MKIARSSAGVRIESGSTQIQFDAPVQSASGFSGRPDAIFCSTGELERVVGLVELAATYDALWVGVPLLDPRAARLVEVVQQVWQVPVEVDLLQPGCACPVGTMVVETLGLTDEERPCLGFHVTEGTRRIVVLPSCEPDGALRRALRGVDDVVAMGTIHGTGWHAWLGDAALHTFESC